MISLVPLWAPFCTHGSYCHWKKLDTWGGILSKLPSSLTLPFKGHKLRYVLLWNRLIKCLLTQQKPYPPTRDSLSQLLCETRPLFPLKSGTQLVTDLQSKGRITVMIFLDPLRVAVQSAVSQWQNHLLIFERISWGEPLSKAGWIWSLRGTPNEL